MIIQHKKGAWNVSIFPARITMVFILEKLSEIILPFNSKS